MTTDDFEARKGRVREALEEWKGGELLNPRVFVAAYYDAMSVYHIAQSHEGTVQPIDGAVYIGVLADSGYDLSSAVPGGLGSPAKVIAENRDGEKALEAFLEHGGRFFESYRDDGGRTEAMILVQLFGLRGLQLMQKYDGSFNLDVEDPEGNDLLYYVGEYVKEESDLEACAEMLGVHFDQIATLSVQRSVSDDCVDGQDFDASYSEVDPGGDDDDSEFGWRDDPEPY